MYLKLLIYGILKLTRRIIISKEVRLIEAVSAIPVGIKM
jgi:hypothetical protein